jgi:hypothetical protein
MPAWPDACRLLGKVGVRCQLPEQLQAAGPAVRIHGENVGFRREDGVAEGKLSDDEFAGGALVVGHGREPRFEQRVVIPEMVLHAVRRTRVNGGADGAAGAKFVPECGHCGGCRHPGGQSDNDVFLPAGHQPPDGRHHVKTHGAAQAAVFQDCLVPLGRAVVAEDPAYNGAVFQKVMDDDGSRGVRRGQRFARLLTAEGVEGTENGHDHDASIMRTVLIYKLCAARRCTCEQPGAAGGVPARGRRRPG